MPVDSTIVQTQTVAETTADWTQPLAFGQFDPSLGILLDVRVGISGEIGGKAAIENLGATAAQVQVNLSGDVVVADPGGASLAAVNLGIPAEMADLGAFEGAVDFAGASGTVISGPSNTATVVSVYLPGSAAAASFVGTGSIDLTASGQGSANETASGNLLSLTQVETGATVSVQYDYIPVLPVAGGSGGYGGTTGGVTTLGGTGGGGSINVQPGPILLTTAAQTFGIADTTTGWNTAVNAAQFNPALGTLQTVNLTLVSDINAGFAVENLGSAAASVSMTDSAFVNLTLPDNIRALATAIGIGSSNTLAAFDGDVDFAGASGSDVAGLTKSQVATSYISSYDTDLSAFIGTGTIGLPIAAYSTSSISGPSNLASELLTKAGATVEISYTYIPNATQNAPTPVIAPAISGTVAGQTVTGETPIAPFASVEITDRNLAQTETVTVTLSSASNGTLTNLGGGTYDVTTGIYTETGSASGVSSALEGLLFTPNEMATTAFNISDFDSALGSATDDTTSVIVANGVAVDTVAAAAAVNAELGLWNAAGQPAVTAANQPVACFAAGTRIATPRGSIAVERLRLGDTVLTVSGRQRKIQWIGRRKIDCRRHPAPERVRPIRIAAHAFGQNRPARPLLLSPDHSVFMDDVLIPVKFLLNETTVVQIDVGSVTYYHLELPSHDVVLAEGLPTETYLETGSRSAFENGGGAIQLHADFAPDEARVGMVWATFGYAPLIGGDGKLGRVRARLAMQAHMLADQYPVRVAATA